MQITVREKELLLTLLGRDFTTLENNQKQAKRADRPGYVYRHMLYTRLIEKIKVEPTVMDGVKEQEFWAGKRF